MFSLVRTNNSPLPIEPISQTVAKQLGETPLDVAQQLGKSPGILWEDLDEAQAKSLSDALADHGVEVVIVPSERVLAMPETVRIDACELDEVGLTYEHRGQTHQVTWETIRWIDTALVGERVLDEKRGKKDAPGSVYYDPESRSGRLHGFGNGFGAVAGHGFPALGRLGDDLARSPWKKTRWVPILDVVADPLSTVIRLELEQFNFHATGQKVHPGRQENTWALAIRLVSSAPHAVCGPGTAWIREGGLPPRHRVPQEELYNNLLRWHLTQIALGTEQPAPVAATEETDSAEALSTKLGELVSLCQEILADGEISLEEIKELHGWLASHRNVELPTVRELAALMQRITADKLVTSSERSVLKQAVSQIIDDN